MGDLKYISPDQVNDKSTIITVRSFICLREMHCGLMRLDLTSFSGFNLNISCRVQMTTTVRWIRRRRLKSSLAFRENPKEKNVSYSTMRTTVIRLSEMPWSQCSFAGQRGSGATSSKLTLAAERTPQDQASVPLNCEFTS